MEARSQRGGQWDDAQRSRGLVSDQDKADGGLREVASGSSPKRQRGIWAGGAGKGTPGGWNSLSKGWRGASEENSGEESLVLVGKQDKLGSSRGVGVRDAGALGGSSCPQQGRGNQARGLPRTGTCQANPPPLSAQDSGLVPHLGALTYRKSCNFQDH